MSVYHKLREPQNLAAQVESVSETRLLALLGRQSPALSQKAMELIRRPWTHLTGFKFML